MCEHADHIADFASSVEGGGISQPHFTTFRNESDGRSDDCARLRLLFNQLP